MNRTLFRSLPNWRPAALGVCLLGLLCTGCYRTPDMAVSLAQVSSAGSLMLATTSRSAVGAAAGSSNAQAVTSAQMAETDTADSVQPTPDPDAGLFSLTGVASDAQDVADVAADADRAGVAPGEQPFAEPGQPIDQLADRPVAVVPASVFDFGTMDPMAKRSHAFTIRNEGDAPLTLTQGPSTCKCTLSALESDSIPPGGESTVTLSWRTTANQDFFGHEAQVYTNDPDNAVLILRVVGKIRATLVFDPPAITVPSIVPGHPQTASLTITSGAWKEFAISDIQCGMPGIQWDQQPLSAAALARLGAVSGHRLTFQIPDDLPVGYFRDKVQMMIQPAGQAARPHEIPLAGKVARRVAVYSPDIDDSGTIHIGKVPFGHGVKKHLTIKVRDEDTDLEVTSLRVQPELLRVAVTPYEQQPGLYRLQVEVPASAPRSVHISSPGTIFATFANPRLEPLKLNVKFAVMGAQDF